MPLLQTAGAALDFARQPFAQLFQMTTVVERTDTAVGSEIEYPYQ
jgi:hypothetical protein